MDCWVEASPPSPRASAPASALRAERRPPLRPSGPADWPRPNTPCLPVNHAKLQLITPNLPLITPKDQINWHLPKKCAVDITINRICQGSVSYLDSINNAIYKLRWRLFQSIYYMYPPKKSSYELLEWSHSFENTSFT